VIHLAASKIPRYSDAWIHCLIIRLGQSDFVDCAVANNVQKAMIASTSDVIGKNPSVPFSEEFRFDYWPAGSESAGPMPSRKCSKSRLVFWIPGTYGIHAVAACVFLAAMATQPASFLVGRPPSVFIDAALDDEPITLHGDGNQTRSFTYIDDHATCGILPVLKKRQPTVRFSILA